MTHQHTATVLVIALSTSAAAFLCACASSSSQAARLGVLTKSGAGVIIQSTNIEERDNGVVVSGTVRRTMAHGPGFSTHMDIEVLDSEGAVLARIPTRYFPSPIPRYHRFPRHSHFSLQVPALVGESTIRVSHHATRIQQCPYRD